MRRSFNNWKAIFLISFLFLALVNLGHLVAIECGPNAACEAKAWNQCYYYCPTHECTSVTYLTSYCESYALCSEDWRYNCPDGSYGFLVDCLSHDEDCEY